MQYYDNGMMCDDEFTSVKEAERYSGDTQESSCLLCGADDDLTNSICPKCYDEIINDTDKILKFINSSKDEQAEFYLFYCNDVDIDHPTDELISIYKAEIDSLISKDKEYSKQLLKNYAEASIEEYIEYLKE